MLLFELGGNASPGRVARIAKALDDAMHIVDPDLKDSSLTLVVRNLNMKGELRAWDSDGEAVVSRTIQFIAKPKAAIGRTSRGRLIAESLAKPLRVLAEEDTTIRLPGHQRILRRVTPDLVDSLVEMAQSSRSTMFSRVRGGDVWIGRILRVGRSSESATIRALLAVDGQSPISADLQFEDGRRLFDAARDQSLCAITVEVTWVNGASGLVPDTKGVLIKGLEIIEPQSGQGIVKDFQELWPNAFQDVDELIDSIQDD